MYSFWAAPLGPRIHVPRAEAIHEQRQSAHKHFEWMSRGTSALIWAKDFLGKKSQRGRFHGTQFIQAAAEIVAQGFLLQADADALVAQAQASNVLNP
jgi:hypothetical protein